MVNRLEQTGAQMEPTTGESSQPHRSPASTNRTPHRVCNLHEPESKCQLQLQEASVKLFLSRITSLRRNNPPTCLRSHHRDYKLYQMAWNQSHASGDRTASPTVFEQQREELVREIAVVSVLVLGMGRKLTRVGHGTGTSEYEPAESEFGKRNCGKHQSLPVTDHLLIEPGGQ